MTIKEYQAWTHTTAVYPQDKAQEYLSLGFLSEVGEVAGKLKKQIRDPGSVTNADVADELGDVMWYLSEIATVAKGELSNLRFIADQEVISDFQCLHGMIAGAFDSAPPLIAAAIATLAKNLGYTVEQIIDMNVEKLTKRKTENKIHGSGDKR